MTIKEEIKCPYCGSFNIKVYYNNKRFKRKNIATCKDCNEDIQLEVLNGEINV